MRKFNKVYRAENAIGFVGKRNRLRWQINVPVEFPQGRKILENISIFMHENNKLQGFV